MPAERRVAFLALSELLALRSNDRPTLPRIDDDLMHEFAGAREDEPLHYIARKFFPDAARALDGTAWSRSSRMRLASVYAAKGLGLHANKTRQ